MPVEQINSAEKALYLHHDQASSTRLITGSAGTVEGKCTYGAYGTPTCEGTATTPLGYDGQYTSADTGLIYLRARVYDPATAQFLTVDPVVDVTLSPYAYTYDNPVNAADPTGLCSIDPFSSNGCLDEGIKATGEGIKEAGDFVVKNPIVISAVGCTVGSLAGPEACVAAITLSYGIATSNNIAAYRDGRLSPEEFIEKQLLSTAVAGAGAVPGLPLLSSPVASLLEKSPAEIQLLINTYLEAPDVAFALLEEDIYCALR